MPSQTLDAQILRSNALPDGKQLDRDTREAVLKRYLPVPRSTDQAHARASGYRIVAQDSFLLSFVFSSIYHVIHAFFTIYISARLLSAALSGRLLSLWYYHHRTPELIQRDLKACKKLPKHLSVVLGPSGSGKAEALEWLVAQVAELAAWCVCAGVETLSIYEQAGLLQLDGAHVRKEIDKAMAYYFSTDAHPTIDLVLPPKQTKPTTTSQESNRKHLNIVLLSPKDGRDTVLDLTKTLVEMTQKGKISTADVTTELLDAELQGTAGFAEPDILLVANSASGTKTNRRPPISPGSGRELYLQGYPPWQLRLTEILHVGDGPGVKYQTFLYALHRYAQAEMRFGK